MTDDFQFNFRGFDRSPMPAPQQVANGFQLNEATQQPGPGFMANMPQQVSDLETEYRQNAARIAAIKQEIAQLEKGALTDDQLDMALASNRAEIGDLGNSVLHQNRIANRKAADETRAWNTLQAELNRKSAKDYTDAQKRELLEEKRDQLKLALTWTKDAKTQDELQNQLDSVESKLRKLDDVEFNWADETPVSETDEFKQALERALGTVIKGQYRTGTDGKWLSEEADRFYETHYDEKEGWNPPEAKLLYEQFAPEKDASDVQKKKANLKKKTKPEIVKAKQDAQNKVNVAINEAMNNKSNAEWLFDMRDTKSDSVSYKATNGKVVTISKAGDGLEFKIGNTRKTR